MFPVFYSLCRNLLILTELLTKVYEYFGLYFSRCFFSFLSFYQVIFMLIIALFVYINIFHISISIS